MIYFNRNLTIQILHHSSLEVFFGFLFWLDLGLLEYISRHICSTVIWTCQERTWTTLKMLFLTILRESHHKDLIVHLLYILVVGKFRLSSPWVLCHNYSTLPLAANAALEDGELMSGTVFPQDFVHGSWFQFFKILGHQDNIAVFRYIVSFI